MKISETTFTPKCRACGAQTRVTGGCENTTMECPACKARFKFEEYQGQFEDWIERSCKFDEDEE